MTHFDLHISERRALENVPRLRLTCRFTVVLQPFWS